MPRAKVPFPADDMIVLAALLGASEHASGWQEAEVLASTLRLLGFVITPQKTVGQLRRLLAEDSPMLERRPVGWGDQYEYRVTRFGFTQLENRFPNTRPLVRHWRDKVRDGR